MKTENFTANFAKNATRLRVRSGLTQLQLADMLNIKRCSIGAIEEGRALGIEKVYLYSIYFDVTMENLITTIIK